MAIKPLRPCRHPGCGALTRDGYCPQHKPKEPPRSPEAAVWRRWYSLKVWTDDLRPGQLLREPFCRSCALRGLRTPATDVDHIRDHKGDWALFTDQGNLQSLCHSCHSKKTMTDRATAPSRGCARLNSARPLDVAVAESTELIKKRRDF